MSEEIQNFDGYFNEISCDLSPYDVRQTQIATMQIKEKFLVLQDSLKPKKKFGFKSRNKKVSFNKRKDDDKYEWNLKTLRLTSWLIYNEYLFCFRIQAAS